MGLRAGSLGGLSRFAGLGFDLAFLFFFLTTGPCSMCTAIDPASWLALQRCMPQAASQQMQQAHYSKAEGIAWAHRCYSNCKLSASDKPAASEQMQWSRAG